MRNILDRVQLIAKATFGLIVFAMFALLFGLMFLGGPIAILSESYDLLRFNAQADGQLTHLDVMRGSKGTSGIRVTYAFNANGNKIDSNQLYPGFAANNGTYSGGSSLSEKYVIGGQVQVFYDSSEPSHSCLEFGWHKWSVGWTAGIWGMVAFVGFRIRKSPLWIGALTFMLYGFGLIAIGPHTVYVTDLHWHMLTILMIAALVATYSFVRPNTNEPSDARKSPVGREFES